LLNKLRRDDITLHGDGLQSRAFCYVDDLIERLFRLMGSSHDVVGPINLGNPEEITMRELAELTIDLTGSRSKIVYVPRPEDDPQQRQPDISRAGALLGWKPRTPLKEGLLHTIEYFDRVLNRLPSPSSVE
jgi:UDP-glucuronate decarboxylase